MTKLLIATRNKAKFDEIASIMWSYKLELKSLNDVNIINYPEETGTTFKDNAIIKAKYYYKKSKLPTIVDDGGLEIAALNGWPGVSSRRMGDNNVELTDDEMIAEVLRRMQGVPMSERQCQMRVVFALVLLNGEIITSEGVTEGYIATEPYKKYIPGFPFRSIFYLPKYGKTVSELDGGKVHTDFMKHRKNAIIKLEPYLKKLSKLNN
ncbi:MAG: non-canonical purine NTP pyrophosphatase [Patescibacteria group bacterium]